MWGRGGVVGEEVILSRCVCECTGNKDTHSHYKPSPMHRYHYHWQQYILTTSQSTGQPMHLAFMQHRNSQQQHQNKHNKIKNKAPSKTAKKHGFASRLPVRRRHSPGLTWVWHMQQLRVELQSSGAAGCASALQALTAAS